MIIRFDISPTRSMDTTYYTYAAIWKHDIVLFEHYYYARGYLQNFI